jgi:hypothetical protein
MQFDDRLLPGAGWNCKLHKMYQCRCTAKNSWWWTERLPEACRVVIPIKLEFSASVWFYSQWICHDARSYDLKIKLVFSCCLNYQDFLRRLYFLRVGKAFCEEPNPTCNSPYRLSQKFSIRYDSKPEPPKMSGLWKQKRNVNVILSFKHVTVALTSRHVIGGFPFREHIWYDITCASDSVLQAYGRQMTTEPRYVLHTSDKRTSCCESWRGSDWSTGVLISP